MIMSSNSRTDDQLERWNGFAQQFIFVMPLFGQCGLICLYKIWKNIKLHVAAINDINMFLLDTTATVFNIRSLSEEQSQRELAPVNIPINVLKFI